MRTKMRWLAHESGDALCQLHMIAWLILEADARHCRQGAAEAACGSDPDGNTGEDVRVDLVGHLQLVIFAARLRQDETDVVLRGGANCLLGSHEIVHDDAVRNVERSDERPQLAVVPRQDTP